MDYVFSGILSLAVAGILGICGLISSRVKKMTNQFNDFKKEHEELLKTKSEVESWREEHAVLLESQRNQLKASIVRDFEAAEERGFITPMELDVLNRQADSYFALDGNHYIHAVVRRANEELEIRGEPIEVMK